VRVCDWRIFVSVPDLTMHLFIYDCSVRLWKDPMRKMMDTNDAIGDASQVCIGWMLYLFLLYLCYMSSHFLAY
jgi:hypothetical protein